MTSFVTPAGTTTYAYDDLGRLVSVTTAEGTTSYKYDLDNNLIETDTPDGTVETRQYDSMNRLTDLKQTGSTGLIAEYQYGYDHAGNRTSETDNKGRVATDVYDALYRLVEESVFDPAGDSFTAVYAYDLAGNRVSKTTDRGNDGTIDETITDAYDANYRLLSEIDNGVTTSFGYDNDGNELSRVTNANDQTQNTWDALGRLTQAVVTSGGTAHTVGYGYDSDGNQVSRTLDGAETKYLVAGSRGLPQVVEEYTPGGVIVARYAFGHGIVLQNRGGQASFYHADALGSVRSLTDASGNVTDRYLYDAYGNVLSHTGSTVNPYGFAGERTDLTTGLLNLRARQYDPSLGRFSSADSFGGVASYPLSLNRYIYALDNPVNMVDPGGHWPTFVSPIQKSVLGTYVHAYLAKQYETVSPQGMPRTRWGNRYISTIANDLGVQMAIYNSRPDMAGLLNGLWEVYEVKPGELTTLADPALYAAESSVAHNEAIFYRGELNWYVDVKNWALGTQYRNGVESYPAFWFKIPGYELMSFNNYAVAPGAFMWDFVDQTSAQTLLDLAQISAVAMYVYLNDYYFVLQAARAWSSGNAIVVQYRRADLAMAASIGGLFAIGILSSVGEI